MLAATAPEPKVEVEQIKKGDGPVVKDGDYALIDFTGWLDGFGGKEIIDSSNANKGQMVKVPIGKGDEGGQGLLANQGRGGTLATQASAASYKDAPTVGSRYRIKIPADLGFGKSGGLSGLGVQVPPSSTVYYEVRSRAKTGRFQTGA